MRYRIIPARAGFTSRFAGTIVSGQDHPRSRGVYVAPFKPRQCHVGSSPLARGLLINNVRDGGAHRIIPARAGFTCPRASGPEPPRDHPRSRGVYRSTRMRSASRRGSSPLARGLLIGGTSKMSADRIIPARAGFTFSGMISLGESTDHPRSRGVYQDPLHPDDEGRGSSPLARGLLADSAHLQAPGRIIPARAGFTDAEACNPSARRDHPRSRGVYSRSRLRGCRPTGSSPLARGLPVGVEVVEAPLRIIPARAGFTRAGTAIRRARADHPRSRGVYSARRRAKIAIAGSSPLARGLQEYFGITECQARIIPARAGFTPRPS